MPGLFENTVSAICYEVANSLDSSRAPFDVPPFNDVVAFVLGQWQRMPRFLAWPLRFATVVFATRGLLSGKFFHQLAPQRRRLQLESWRTSSIGPCRNLIRCLDRAGQPLSDYSEACLRRVAEMAANGEEVYLAPGNAFGHSRSEDEIAAGFLRQLRSDLVTHHIDDVRRGYLDTLDNALWLREWARRHNRWPMAECWLYCNRYHVVRAWLCFRVAGYRARRIVACPPAKRSGQIVSRLRYYDYPAVNLVYEALAIAHTFLRLAKNFVRTGRLLPALEIMF